MCKHAIIFKGTEVKFLERNITRSDGEVGLLTSSIYGDLDDDPGFDEVSDLHIWRSRLMT